jgi:uncharacterized protein (PEP-CTERM system associated)
MTITTAKRPAARALKLAPLAIAALLLSAQCRADWKFTPQVEVRESYSDNVALLPANQAQSSWITEASPSFSLVENGPRLKLNANASWRTFAYSNSDVPNLQSSTRQYNAQGTADLVDQLLYLDGGASSTRQAISAFGPANASPYTDYNNTDIRTWRLSPYLRHRFGSTADLEVRYSRDAVSGGSTGFGDSMSSTRSANLASGTAYGNFGWNLSYYHQDLSDQYAGHSSSQSAQAGARYLIVPRFALTGTIGYDDYDYPTLAQRTGGRSWTVGFDWQPSTRTSVKATWGRRYFGKTGSLDAVHRTPHTIWSATYSDQVTTSRQQFVLPAAFDTAAMLDNLFAATYPDPVQRQQAVNAYITTLGLPATLRDNINFLSNRYERDRHLQGNLTFRGARSSLVLSVFNDRRNALSLSQSDSVLLGNQMSNLNDNVRQRGASANFSYRVSSRTNATVSTNMLRATSPDTNFSSNNRDLRLGLTHAFGIKTRGSVELRHLQGDYGVGSAPYRENAIAATLAVVY